MYNYENSQIFTAWSLLGPTERHRESLYYHAFIQFYSVSLHEAIWWEIFINFCVSIFGIFSFLAFVHQTIRPASGSTKMCELGWEVCVCVCVCVCVGRLWREGGLRMKIYCNRLNYRASCANSQYVQLCSAKKIDEKATIGGRLRAGVFVKLASKRGWRCSNINQFIMK